MLLGYRIAGISRKLESERKIKCLASICCIFKLLVSYMPGAKKNLKHKENLVDRNLQKLSLGDSGEKQNKQPTADWIIRTCFNRRSVSAILDF